MTQGHPTCSTARLHLTYPSAQIFDKGDPIRGHVLCTIQRPRSNPGPVILLVAKGYKETVQMIKWKVTVGEKVPVSMGEGGANEQDVWSAFRCATPFNMHGLERPGQGVHASWAVTGGRLCEARPALKAVHDGPSRSSTLYCARARA